MWLQEFIVGLIVAVCLIYIGRIIWQKVNYIKDAKSFENNRNCVDCPLVKPCNERKKELSAKKSTKTLAD